jgi:hypothetical protein
VILLCYVRRGLRTTPDVLMHFEVRACTIAKNLLAAWTEVSESRNRRNVE